MQKSAAFLMISVLVLGFVLMDVARQPPAALVDENFADWIATNSARAALPTHVALVEINDSSLSDAHAWPWGPLDYTLFLRAVLQLKPGVVAIEPILNWKANDDAPAAKPQALNELHDYILQTPKLVLGAQLGVPEDSDAAPQIQPVPLLRNIKGDAAGIPEYTDIVKQSQDEFRLSATAGFTNLAGGGEIAHKAPLVFNYRGEIVPSLVLQALIQWFKLTPDDVTVEPGRRILLGKSVVIPIDGKGRMNVDFSAPFQRLGYDDLLLAVDQSQRRSNQSPQTDGPTTAAMLNGSVTLLARTDKDARTLLFPSRAKGSPGELFARAVATVQARSFAGRVSHWFDFGVIAVMMLLCCVIHCFSKRAFLLLSFVLLLAYLFLGMSMYSLLLLWVPLVLPLGLLFLVNFFSLFSPRTRTPKTTPANGIDVSA